MFNPSAITDVQRPHADPLRSCAIPFIHHQLITVTYFNQTTGFCGVILATLITVNLPTNFGADTFKGLNAMGRKAVPDTCLVSESVLDQEALENCF